MRGLLLILAVLLLFNAGCGTVAYYSQAVAGQCQMLCCQQSVAALAADPSQSGKLRAKLKLVLELRDFARDRLGMDPGDNYLNYKSLDRKYALWVVYAAPEFDTNLKSWWYPVAGRFISRGWFSEASARQYADSLRVEGLDVHIGGAPAYSTLGWFADPVLSTFIDYSETDLAELIFHELAHRRYFMPGDATFNESFATATAQAGVLHWLKERGAREEETRYRDKCARQATFVRLALKTRGALEALYGSSRVPAEIRTRKAAIIDKFKKELLALHEANPEYSGLARWAKRPINNANLAAIAVYNQQVPAFMRLFSESGGDFEKYFSTVEALSKLAKPERSGRIKSLNRED